MTYAIARFMPLGSEFRGYMQHRIEMRHGPVAAIAIVSIVFAINVLECPRCQGPMKILAPIHPPDTTRNIQQCLGLPARAPPVAPARPDPQESLRFDSDGAAPLD